MSDTADVTRLDDLLAAAGRRHPHRPAIHDGCRTVSYADLDHTVTAFAQALRSGGVGPGHRVGVQLPRSIEAVTTLYAVLRAGAIAAPLEPTDPPERTARLAGTCGLNAIVTSCHDAHPSSQPATALITPAIAAPLPSGLTLRHLSGPDPSPAGGYLLHTSGSTGRPKGVLLSHQNVGFFVQWAVREFRLRPTDRIGSQSALTFDLSTFDIFGAALAGACLCLLPETAKLFPQEVVGWLAEARITVFYAVPTLYRALLERGGITDADLPHLRLLAFAGEPFPAPALQRYTEAFPGTAFYNLYGPTETNVCTFERLPADWSAAAGLAIGRPLPGIRVALVDEHGRAVAAEGEIAVAGPLVFQGYLEQGTLRRGTSEVTFPDGTIAEAYRTGDLARSGPDGRLYLRGRRDHQVKRRGYRIELHEIENVAAELPGVHSCAAVWQPGPPGQGRITLYAVTSDPTADMITGQLRAVLPRAAIPDRVELVDELPINERGKVDRAALVSGSTR